MNYSKADKVVETNEIFSEKFKQDFTDYVLKHKEDPGDDFKEIFEKELNKKDD